MTGEKLARIRKCQGHGASQKACEHWRNNGGWPWPRCKATGEDGGGLPGLELNDEFFHGPETNCPLGKWAGLEPAVPPPPPTYEAQAERFIMRQDPLLKRLDNRNLSHALLELVAAGRMPREMADAIALKKGIDLDEPV